MVRMYYDQQAAEQAQEAFKQIFVKKDVPDDMPEIHLEQSKMRIDELMIQTKTAESKGQARRLIQGGGVSVDGGKISDPYTVVAIGSGQVLKVGKRKFVKLT